MGDGLHICVLGPVSVRAGDHEVPVRSRPQRIVLACLALEADRVVSTGTLLDALWPGDAPPNATGNLHSYVSKLRRLVGPERIRRAPAGYRLAVDRDAVDALRAERLADAATHLDGPALVDLLDEALALWEGEPLADLDDVHALVPDRTRLAALRRQLGVRRLAALVDAGDPGVEPELRDAVARHPHDEAVVALLARALHASGRAAEALRAIAEGRRRIADDTGLEIGADLARLEERILFDAPERPGGTPGPAAGVGAPGIAPATADWPRHATPLFGRDGELDRLDELARAPRIVTLTGTGGVGKTRLACALADRRSAAGQAVHFLPLAALAGNDGLGARLAAALGLRVPAAQDPADAVHERIGSGGQLLVLDNCEHLLDAVRELVEALTDRRSDLTVLITSRGPLGLAREHVVRIAPLDPADGAGRDLFVERARRVRPDVQLADADDDAVRTVIRGVGGLPLAIELAAGRMASMSLGDLAARIGDLDLLTSGEPTERHRTLRSAIDWSYRLLPQPAQRLLRTLSLFPAGVDLAGVEHLAPDLRLPGGGTLEVLALADASLVDAQLEPATRYTMLEPVRAFADERLDDAGDRAVAQSLRARSARDTAAWVEDAGRSPEEAAADARLRSELPNLRAAHQHALRHGDLDTAISISTPLVRPATARDLPEVWSWALELGAHPRLREHPRCPDGLGAAATAAWLTGDLHDAERLAEDGLRRDPDSVPCLQAMASVCLFLGQPGEARRLWVAASRPHGTYLPQAALAAVYEGDAEVASGCLADAEAWAAGTGSPTEVALCRYARGELLGPDPAAIAHYEESIALASGCGATFVTSISRVGLASALARSGQHRRAAEQFDTVIRYWRTTGNRTQQWTTLRNVADLLAAVGRPSTARRIRTAASAAPAAAAVGPGPTADVADPGDASPGDAPEALVALVLAELADLRRSGPLHAR